MTIHFFDCPNCGKSLRVGARACHHCQAVEENDWADPDVAAEFATGGYSNDDDEEAHKVAPTTVWQRIVLVVVVLLLLSFSLELLLPLIRLPMR